MTGPFSSFFELRDNPFRANPDPRYLFLTRQTKETLDQIIEGIRERKGLLVLTGEVGTGKTVLLNRLMEWLEQERIPKAFIFNSHLKASELFDLILSDFGIPFNVKRGTQLAHLHSWLQDRFCAGQTPVVFVDEAQGLPLHTLEELRMLLNLQTSQGNLLQIVLCGQPEFEETLKRPALRQLRQRIALRCRTSPLTLKETQDYIEAHLLVAGGSGAAVFHPEAVQALLLYSRGLPRVLNVLCERSLLQAAREKIRPVPGRMVGEAAHELQYDEIRPFIRHSGADDGVFSDLLEHSPGSAGTPEFSAAAGPFGQDAPLDALAPGIPSCAPIGQQAVERSSAPGLTAPLRVVRAEAAKPENDFRNHWRHHQLSVTNRVKSALSAIAWASRIRLAQLQTRTLSLFRFLSAQWSVWRNKNWNIIQIDFQWTDFASACLRWLRAPSRARQRRHALPKPSRPARETESSARILATQPPRRNSLPRASRSKFIRGLEKAPRVTTSILQWLQEPSHSMRERKSTRSSNTDLP